MKLTALSCQLGPLMKSIEHIGTEVAPRVRDMMHG